MVKNESGSWRGFIGGKRMDAHKSPAQLKRWFDSAEFEKEYHCDAPLGAWLDAEGTHFALWAPTARQVMLNLYPDGGKSTPMRSMLMKQGARGLWEYDDPARLNGVYYDYDVTVQGTTCRTQDPYAKACGVNGQRGMVVELTSTDPEGWAQEIGRAHV